MKGSRYDMLCFEGISLMLNIFRGKTTSPNYRLAVPPSGELQTITVHEEVGSEETHGHKVSQNSNQSIRPHAYAPMRLVPFYEILNSPKTDTIPSLLFRISYTRILAGIELWLQ